MTDIRPVLLQALRDNGGEITRSDLYRLIVQRRNQGENDSARLLEVIADNFVHFDSHPNGRLNSSDTIIQRAHNGQPISSYAHLREVAPTLPPQPR